MKSRVCRGCESVVLVDKGQLIHTALSRLARIGEGESVLLQPHKKDRAVCLVLQGTTVHVFEQGFVREDFSVAKEKLKKLLKGVCRREFPRSHKIWLTRLDVRQTELFIKRYTGG